MPTLDSSNTETKEEVMDRIERRALEMGITYSFSEYIDNLEDYLFTLEERVRKLEK